MKPLSNQISESYIQAEEYIYLQIKTQIQQFNLLNKQINIISFSDTFFCYQYKVDRDILLIGLNDNTIIYGKKSLQSMNIMKTKFLFNSLSLDLTQIIVNNQMIQGSPTDISLQKYIKNLLFKYNLIGQSKFCLHGRTQLTFFTITQNQQMQFQIELISTINLNIIINVSTQFDCISVKFIDSNYVLNINIYSFKNLILLEQVIANVSQGINEVFFCLKNSVLAYL
ncbi:hypothetical protein ABPG72_019116 [Tetrahymena utriculariae]